MSKEETQTEKPTKEPERKAQPFTMTPVKSKPSRSYRKGSIYDPILDAFLASKDKMVSVAVPDKDANYMRTQINNRLVAKSIKNIKVSVVNDVLYIERK